MKRKNESIINMNIKTNKLSLCYEENQSLAN